MATQVGKMLDEINATEQRLGRPMLSAIVVSSVSWKPGKGFFNLARNTGKLQGTSPEEELKFWETEKQALYRTWEKKY
jgi:hypothetical protein